LVVRLGVFDQAGGWLEEVRTMKDRAEDALEVDEFVIRLFMIVGACIWIAAAAMAYVTGELEVFYGYSVVALFTVAVLAVGWFYERIAEAALLVAAGALIAWGVSAGWEAGIWLMMGATVILPMIVAAALFAFEVREERVIEGVEHHALPVRGAHA